MGSRYAGVLAPLAMVTTLLRGQLHGAPVEATLLAGWLALLAFAVVGYLIGGLAGWILEESVRERLRSAHEARSQSPASS